MQGAFLRSHVWRDAVLVSGWVAEFTPWIQAVDGVGSRTVSLLFAAGWMTARFAPWIQAVDGGWVWNCELAVRCWLDDSRVQLAWIFVTV